MTHDDEQLGFAVYQLDEARREQARDLAELRTALAALVDLLVARGVLNEGHRRHLGRAARHAPGDERKVRLRVLVDKYTLEPGPPIDCLERFPLCKARCCRLKIELTEQDVEEGKVRWNLEEPYLLRKDADGQCTHLDRATGGCTVYDVRPATCREFDCREDQRIWIDFEKRIPAPMPSPRDWP
jgi:hypothetical protein